MGQDPVKLNDCVRMVPLGMTKPEDKAGLPVGGITCLVHSVGETQLWRGLVMACLKEQQYSFTYKLG